MIPHRKSNSSHQIDANKLFRPKTRPRLKFTKMEKTAADKKMEEAELHRQQIADLKADETFLTDLLLKVTHVKRCGENLKSFGVDWPELLTYESVPPEKKEKLEAAIKYIKKQRDALKGRIYLKYEKGWPLRVYHIFEDLIKPS